jgi:hypothetical protein
MREIESKMPSYDEFVRGQDRCTVSVVAPLIIGRLYIYRRYKCLLDGTMSFIELLYVAGSIQSG